jgi:CheY-like chemotaxis protein
MDKEEQLQETITRVRYCKVLALRLGLDTTQVDSAILAAWLSGSGMGDHLLNQITTPYRLREVLKPEESGVCKKRVEASILSLVKKYQILKKNNPAVTSNIALVRRELDPQFPSPEDKSLLETFLHVIRDEEFLKDVDQFAGRILIVDPDYSPDTSIALRLSNDGYEVTGVPDASKAAKVIMNTGTDLVISEVSLPGKDGVQFCRVLRKSSDAAHIPFFFLTAEEGDRLATECLEAGADDFVKKPVDLDLLSLKVRHILYIKAPKEAKRGITGTLSDMSASDIIQSLTSGDKNVEIHLESMGEKGQIYIQEGEIIHSQARDLNGEEAFYRLMAWHAGEFEIVACSTFPARTIHSSTMSLLMEGARLADELSAGGEA